MPKVIIDGNHLLHRSCYKGFKLLASNGSPTGGMFLFMKNLLFLRDVGDLIVVFDSRHSERRISLLPNYKNRITKQEPREYKSEEEKQEHKAITDSFSFAISNLPDFLRVLGIPVLIMDGTEADDVVYRLCEILSEDNKVFVVTEDEDYMQMLRFPRVEIYRPVKDLYVNLDSFNLKYKIPLEYFILWKALIGDSSDNIDGVQGIGPVRATKIVNAISEHKVSEFPSVYSELCLFLEDPKGISESLIPKLREGLEIIKRNILLMDIQYSEISKENVNDVWKQESNNQLDYDRALSFFKLYEFNSIVGRYLK